MSRVLLTVVFCATSLSRSVSANPISTPFDYALEIAVFNFPLNGFLLLALYFVLVKRGAPATHFGPKYFFILFLACTAIISATGGIVDSAAYMTFSLPVFIVATALIGMIAGIVAYRYLRLGFEASWVVGVVFFVVNLMSWTLLASDAIIIITYEYCYALWIVLILYLFILAVLAKEHQGGVRAVRFGTPTDPRQRPIPGYQAETYPVMDQWPSIADSTKTIVVEAVVLAGCSLLMLIFLYSVWFY
jgi:hypothetical protein